MEFKKLQIRRIWPKMKRTHYSFTVNFNEMIFEVVEWTPMPGVTVNPKDGVIQARGRIELQITMQIPVIMTFAFDVSLKIQNTSVITLKVCGRVCYPMVSKFGLLLELDFDCVHCYVHRVS